MNKKVTGKTVLITGSTDGLGKLVARHLVEKGAKVLLHGRNPEKGEKVKKELSGGNHQLEYFNADFASLAEVKKLAEDILKDHPQIDVLINNVGIGRGKERYKRELSKDGFELRFAVNYLSHVLLTEKLLPHIPDGSKIINVASVGQATIDFNDIMLEKKYEGFEAYKQSKTALIMFTFDLAERLKSRHIKVNALHPASLMNTKMVTEDWDYTLSTVEQGAEAVETVVDAETTGEYYDGKKVSRAIEQAYDRDARNALEKVTWEMLKGYL